MGLKPVAPWPYQCPLASHLAHRHTEDAGVQQAGGRVGAHLTHEGEPLPPPHTVLLHLLPAGQRDSEHKGTGSTFREVRALLPLGQGGKLSLFTLYHKVTVFS